MGSPFFSILVMPAQLASLEAWLRTIEEDASLRWHDEMVHAAASPSAANASAAAVNASDSTPIASASWTKVV
ncbi:hypothetical protein GCM10007897_05560 [Sphingobium jiangsuense]|nr:hypothetical protein GCM10007897_05560 [Sphingobium jiangsuense]